MTQEVAKTQSAPAEFDVVVVGAGFSGVRALIEMRALGLSTHLLEAGTDVGGVWYWNRYPGARTDTESWAYCYSFAKDLLQEWNWRDRYPAQADVQAYLAHVVDRFDLRRDMEFNSRIASIVRDSTTNKWTVTTADNRSYRCQFVIAATGGLAFGYRPDFPGLERFRGEWYMSSAWPKEPVDFIGKRVGIIGTGSTGVQMIPLVAQTAEHLTVFQRTPNFVLPGRNSPLEDEQRKAIKQNYDEIWELAHNQTFGFPMHHAGRNAVDTTPEERHRVFEEGWEKGGFRFIFETFDDLFVNEEANASAAEFIRGKIRAIVHDPQTAEQLSPRNHPLGSKRPPFGNQYYETFNRDNVTLVDVGTAPITEITATGARTANGEYDVDVLIFATGFEVGTGSLGHIDVRGEGGLRLNDVWRDGPQTLLGIAVTGFPNFFMIAGPQSSIGNAPPVSERVAAWIGGVISHMRQTGTDVIEADQDAMNRWAQVLQAIVDTTLLEQGKKANSWYFGANRPGGGDRVVLYLAGVPSYFSELRQSVESGYRGFTFSAHRQLPGVEVSVVS